MQFIVFAAFAIVLSVPPGGPPWSRMTSPAATWLVVIGQVLVTAIMALFGPRGTAPALTVSESARSRRSLTNCCVATFLYSSDARFTSFAAEVQRIWV